MDENTLDLLEYENLLKCLAGFARSEPGMERCMFLRPDLDRESITLNWRLIDEARELLGLEGPPPLDDLVDIEQILDRLEVEGFILKSGDLMMVLKVARASRLMKGFVRAQAERCPLLLAIAESLPLFNDLEHELEKSIGPEGEILDAASAELARVRRELGGMRGIIQKKMTGLMRIDTTQAALQDDIITRRAGRYVIPVQASLRSRVPGLVHDYSKSGQTAFVEPLEMVEDNNRLNLLRRKEKKEIERVLARLSALAAAAMDDLSDAADDLADLDVIFAQGALSLRQKARAPFYEENCGVDLLKAYHPLLQLRAEADKAAKTVPLDLKLDPENRLLVISGINAGGKTVALKTLGLLILMARTGLHLPVAEGSRLDHFENVMASIGDEQDIQSDLSTFSGHIRRISQVLENSTESSLVLLDELGTGTDPAEGAALALAVLDELRLRKAYVVTATHYHLLKAWAHLTEGAENAAVRTDVKGKPVFGLDYGTPGYSSGLAMARDLGLHTDIVAKAETYMDEGQKKTMGLIRQLEEERAVLTETRNSCEALEEELSAALARAAEENENRARSYNEKVKSLGLRVDQAIRDAEKSFSIIEDRMKKREKSRAHYVREFGEAKKDLRQTLPKPVRGKKPLQCVEPGDPVMVESLGRRGKVVSFNPVKKSVEVDIDGLKVKTGLDDLTRPTGHEPKKKKISISWSPAGPLPREINLLGQTVDEALSEVEKTLDEALVGGVKQFSIIHGIGTGKLRQAVRSYLQGDERVKEFHRGAHNAGGEGVTTVELNE